MGLPLHAVSALDLTSCCTCGIEFAVPQHWLQKKRENGQGFHCPNGHNLSYGESEVQRLQKALAQEKVKTETAQRDARWQKEERERMEKAAAKAEKRQKAAKTRLKNLQARVSKGYCPCCKQNFPEVYAHIVNEHPKYAAENPEVVSAGVKGLLPVNGGAR